MTKRIARQWPSAVLVRRRGARFLLHPQNWIDNRIFAGAPFERAQIAAAKAVIAERNIDTLIDIGANIGFYTVLLGRMPQITRVIAFEPVRRNYAQLLGNVFVNGLSSKVDVHRRALGAVRGTAEIHIDPTSTGVSRINLATTSRSPDAFADRETIEIAVFDDVCHLKGRGAFVKIDVEGGAVGVLQGMSTFLASNDAIFQIELSDAEYEGVTDILGRVGYKLSRKIEGDAIFIRD